MKMLRSGRTSGKSGLVRGISTLVFKEKGVPLTVKPQVLSLLSKEAPPKEAGLMRRNQYPLLARTTVDRPLEGLSTGGG
jgi:hypothetical protein